MNKKTLKYLAMAAVAVTMSIGCVKEKPMEPCEQDGTGILKLNNKTSFRGTVKIDGKTYGQIEAREVKEYVLKKGENIVCVEINNAICYWDFTCEIIPCEIITKELDY